MPVKKKPLASPGDAAPVETEAAPKRPPLPATARRIYYLSSRDVGPLEAFAGEFRRIRALGFEAALISPLFATRPGRSVFHPLDPDRPDASLETELPLLQVLARLSRDAEEEGLAVLLDLNLCSFDAMHPWVLQAPGAFSIERTAPLRGPIDPRRPAPRDGEARARLWDPSAAETLVSLAVEQVAGFAGAGVRGVRLLGLAEAAPEMWRALCARVRSRVPQFQIIAEAQGAPWAHVLALEGCGLDALTSSLPFWDGRSSWLASEIETLRRVAPVLSEAAAPFGSLPLPALWREDPVSAAKSAIALAAGLGAGWIMPMGLEFGEPALDPVGGRPERFKALASRPALLERDVIRANAWVGQITPEGGELRQLTSPDAPLTAFLRAGGAEDLRFAEAAWLILINPGAAAASPPSALLGGVDFTGFEDLEGGGDGLRPLAARSVRLARGVRRPRVAAFAPGPDAAAAAAAARVVIDAVSPSAAGPFAVKRVVGDTVVVEADVFADGHETLAAEVRWRALDEGSWASARMTPLGNDRWRAAFQLERLGAYEYQIEAWLDRFAGQREDFAKKLEAGVATPLDLEEGWTMIQAAAEGADVGVREALRALLDGAEGAPASRRRRLLLAPETLELMSRADERPFRVRTSPPQRVDAERPAARFASWYELFPRSITDDASRPGRLLDVIKRLPAIRRMGFDVLYFPPIHPIGRTNRKGPNNSLVAEAGDPGSPYAIGAEEGGHDAVHPELGTLEDFRALRHAAAAEGLEIALDFAIQCSPDHPWLRTHPDWFAWRLDGSMKYAENPPKKYQDIVNVDFYAAGSVPDLWNALREVVRFWINEGVKIFRVDNPHTKPLPFWEWLIQTIRLDHPDVIFLAEAFTRPKVMYRLAKIGFSQSYTYFTWRNSKRELTAYLEELSQEAPREFFRPHFFVNTPDINPSFLQSSGRSGFLIRAALAATLSGLWGIYSGFELLEADPLPGREEYKDSEKFQIRPRDFSDPGICEEITVLNRLRRSCPQLQTHLDVEFLDAPNDNVLAFAKGAEGAAELIVVVISLDPFGDQSASVEIPFWRFGVEENDPLLVDDLLSAERTVWRGRRRPVWLGPGRPYALWRIHKESAS